MRASRPGNAPATRCRDETRGRVGALKLAMRARFCLLQEWFRVIGFGLGVVPMRKGRGGWVKLNDLRLR